MLHVVLALVAAMWCGMAAAMPTDDEIKKVNPIIEQLTKDDFNEMKAGKKSRVQLAEAMLGYLDEAESEAAKFVLIRQAFRQYMVAGDVPKAVETFGRLEGNVEGVPNGTFGEWCALHVSQLAKSANAVGLAEMLERTLDGGDAESATALYKQIKPQQRKLFSAKTGGKRLAAAMDRFARTERRQKEARNLRVAVRKNPDDTALREKLGFMLVAANDWKAALKEFAQTSGKLAEVAVWENTYPDTKSSSLNEADVAEFWWNKADAAKEAEVSAVFRRHAAGWYLAAIESGKLTGLKKTWGLYDMIGNLDEIVYDRIPLVVSGERRRGGMTVSGMDYSDATDPLAWDDGEEPVSLARTIWASKNSGPGWSGVKKCLLWRQRVSCVGFRIVAGPDLVKERKLKSRAK